MHTVETFAHDELVKAFLRGFLSDEYVHGVPLDVLPPEIKLSFNTGSSKSYEPLECS